MAASQGNVVFVRLACNYLPTAAHLALGLVFIGAHNALQPLVIPHRLLVILLQSRKLKIILKKERGHITGILAIPKGNLWEFAEVESKSHSKLGLQMEFRDESQLCLPFFAQGGKLPMTSPLFSVAKHISFK